MALMAKDLEAVRQELDRYDAVKIRMRVLLERGLQLEERVWGVGLTDEEIEEFWAWVDKHPQRFKAMRESFRMFFAKFAPTRIVHEGSPGNQSRFTADKLEKLGLNPDQIEQLAALEGNEEQDENTE